MSSILLKIDFKDKKHISKKILSSICNDVYNQILYKNLFDTQDNIYIKYNLKKN